MNEYKNVPLRGSQVQNLPIGFNITGYYPNKRMRRAMFQNPSSSKGRVFQVVVGGFQSADVADEGRQIIPMWEKKVPYVNAKGRFTGQIKTGDNGIQEYIPNMIWVLHPAVKTIERIKTIEHLKTTY